MRSVATDPHCRSERSPAAAIAGAAAREADRRCARRAPGGLAAIPSVRYLRGGSEEASGAPAAEPAEDPWMSSRSTAEALRDDVPSDVPDDDVITVTITDRDGRVHALQALDGWRLMEVIRDWGLPIRAECGGACACGTCHVYVDPAWIDRLVSPTEEEMDQLDRIWAVETNSRLSCQILTSQDLDGLEVILAPGSETES
jgi:2Fe-2S ferredoxin